MALNVFEQLLEGNVGIVESFRKVKNYWEKLINDFDWNDSDVERQMADLLTEHQLHIEYLAGERFLGQEVMVIVCIGYCFGTIENFEENKRRANIVLNGFLMSYCSMEVKLHAEDIGTLYRLDIYGS